MKFFTKNIYKYDDNGNIKLCVYVCDTDNANEIIIGCIEKIDELNNDFIKLDCLNNDVLYLDRYKVLKTDMIKGPYYNKGKKFAITSKEYYQLVSSIYQLLLVKYEKLVNCYNNRNFANDKFLDIMQPEKLIKLLTWNIKKLELKFADTANNLNIVKYRIYFAYLGTNVGSEIEKLRPVIVWREHKNVSNKNNDVYYVFPISSKISKKLYSYNIPININGKKNIVKLNYGQMISRRRFLKPYVDCNCQTITLSEDDKTRIKKSLKKYFGTDV